MALAIWKGAPRMAGAPLGGFIALKAPITLEAADGGPDDEEDAFSPTMFMQRQTAQGRSVGLVIDMCAEQPGGKRLYEASEWDDWDVAYESIPCAPPLLSGKIPADDASTSTDPLWAESPPSEEQCQTFISVCSNFWRQEANHKRYIAVHCVTGINLAGYMIVRYLLQRGPLTKALDLFATHRPPGIYSVDLLEALWKSTGTPLPPAQQWRPPPPPSWHPLRQRVIGKPAVPLFNGISALDKRPALPVEGAGEAAMPSAKRPRSDLPSHTHHAAEAHSIGLAEVATRLNGEEGAKLRSLCQATSSLS